MRTLTSLAITAALLSACDPAPEEVEITDPGLAILGGNTHSIDAVALTEISGEKLNVPRDLAFHPDDPSQLWVVSGGNDSMTIFSGVGTDALDVVKHRGSTHFLAKPAALAFGDNGGVATAQDEDEVTQPDTPTDFMGPTLWTSDADIFDGEHETHLDMLHNSPNSVGIAWQTDNAYWIFDGYHSSLTLYDFNQDHDLGGTDHTDGEIYRYVEDEVAYEDGVSSHLIYEAETGFLYVADTGNGRVAVLDTATGEKDGNISPNYDGARQKHMSGADLWTLIDGAEHGITAPSGLEIHDGVLYVADNATSTIYGFSLDGELIDWLETGLAGGALMGMAFSGEGDLFLTDAVEDRVLRISPL